MAITSDHSAIQSFLDYLKSEKRYSDHTITAYGDDLQMFTKFLALEYKMHDPPLAEISTFIIKSWLANLKEQKQSAKSINRRSSTLKSFFRYHLIQGNIEKTPMSGVLSPKVSKRLPQYVAQKDMDTLFNHVEFPDTWEGMTNRLLIAIFYNTGMRLSELMNLKESYINQAGNSLKVLGKGNKERIIPVSPELIAAISAYIARKRAELEAPDTTFLLVSEKGKKLYAKYLYRVVKTYLGEVTTLDKKSPHVLRHTFATHLMNNGADLNAVKELLGHASLASTQVYTHNTIARLKEIYEKAHPKA
jgi:integrase/recombinase XerC